MIKLIMNKVYESLFDNLSYGFLVNLGDIRSNKVLKDICQGLTNGYRGIGVLHSHSKASLGSYGCPHLHILLDVPTDKLDIFHNSLKSRKQERLRNIKDISIVNDKNKAIIKNWRRYLAYILGNKRLNLPHIVWIKSSPR